MDLTDFKNLIASTASICTVLQFLTGTLVCLQVVQEKTTGSRSPFPFISGLLATSLWLRYGFFLNDLSIILVNTIGASLFLGYVVTFAYYTHQKSNVVRQFVGCFLFVLLTLIYLENEHSLEQARNRLGIICCLVSILFFAAPLATLMHVIRVKSTESLPFPVIFAGFIVSLQWLIYGMILDDPFIQIPNFLGAVLSGFQLVFFCLYPSSSKGHSTELI